MADEKIEFEHEVGGFNPERREEKSKTQVGPAPTDDPRGKAAPISRRRSTRSARKCHLTKREKTSWQ